MFTDYRKLSFEEKVEIEKIFNEYEHIHNKEIVWSQIVKGNNCAYCFMIYYNCLCGYEE